MTRYSLVALISLGVLFSLSGASNAQRRDQRNHVFLPPARGGTVMGSWISAQAQYQAAAGDYLESAAIARLYLAEAALKEEEVVEKRLENNRKWLEWYFERKLLNRDYRRQLDPPHVEREQKRDNLTDNQIRNAPSRLIEDTDLTKKLNWLLVQLAVSPESRQILFGAGKLDTFRGLDLPLSVQQLSGLNLCLIERVDGKENVFPADRGSALMSEFPLVLKEKEFAKDRDAIKAMIKRIAKDLEDGELQISSWEDAQHVIEQFRRSLNSEYPKDLRDSEPSIYFHYKDGDKYLDAQLAAVKLAVKSNNADGLNGGLAFQGDSLFQLLNHMSKRGLRFAPASPGNKPVYTILFLAMRDVYLQCNPNTVDDVENGFQR